MVLFLRKNCFLSDINTDLAQLKLLAVSKNNFCIVMK